VSPAEHRLTFESFGAVAEVVCDERQLFDSLPDALPPGWQASSGEPVARFALTRDGTITLDGAEFFHNEVGREQPLLRLGSVIRHHLALHARTHAFVHAGVVGVGGVAIVIPGSSHSGKTMLVAELVRSGAMYYSDEYAVVDSAGMIHPYAKPLSIRAEPGDGLGVPVAVPPAQTAVEPIRAGLIVITNYEQGASWRPGVCTRAEGAFELLQHTVAARPRPAQSLAAASHLSREALVISGPRGESAPLARVLMSCAGDIADGRVEEAEKKLSAPLDTDRP
jgi:hypothetical protein